MNEFFIARRYLKAKHKINFISILSFISWLGISVGVAAMIIVISVFNGFGSLVKELLISYDPHIIIHSNDIYDVKKTLSEEFWDDKRIKNFSLQIEAKGILYNSNYNLIQVKGLETETLNELGLKKNQFVKSHLPEVFIGQILAAKLGVLPGDTILISSLNSIRQSIIDFTSLPRISKAVVVSIFNTNNKEYDDKYIFSEITDAQKILGGQIPASTIEIRLNDINDLSEVKNFLEQKFSSKITITTWYDLHKNLYDVMQIERWSAFILLSMIISVAVFNILSTLTMMVVEKKRDIGILKTMGYNDFSIKRLFLYQGFLIGLIGIFFGLIIGLGVCYLQIEYKFYALDASKYIIDALPIKVEIADLLIITLSTLLLTALASIYPSKKANSINIIESIKYE